jgi:putative flippase GtrA
LLSDRPTDRAARVLRWIQSREFAFLVVGGLNTLLGLVSFALFYRLFGDTLHYLGSLVLAYVVGIGASFVVYRRFVYKVRGNVLLDLVRFTGVNAGTFFLNAVCLPILVELAHLPVIPAQVLSIILVTVASYLGHTFISFRRPAD